jgi:hypothetical protein
VDVSYTETAEPSWRASKRRRTAITLLVLLALLAAAIYYFSTYWKDETSGRTPCPTTSAAVGGLRPATITINVLNATKRNGLAGKTSTTLKGIGFLVATVANDPLKKTIAGTAEIRYGAKGADAAKLVATYVPKSVLVLDKRNTSVVDVVLGEAFTAVAAPTATATSSASTSTCG